MFTIAVLMPVTAALTVVEKSTPAKLVPGETLANYARRVGFVLGRGGARLYAVFAVLTQKALIFASLTASVHSNWQLIYCLIAAAQRIQGTGGVCAVGPRKVVLNDNAPAEGP